MKVEVDRVNIGEVWSKVLFDMSTHVRLFGRKETPNLCDMLAGKSVLTLLYRPFC